MVTTARKKGRKAPLTIEQRKTKALERHSRRISDAAAIAGVPEIQRDAQLLEIHQVPQIANHTNPIKETVRRLTPIERLARAGALEPHEAAACEWYAERYTLGFDTIGCTANYEGGSGGGSHVFDLLARNDAQMRARDDYQWARSFIAPVHVPLFEAIICRGQSIDAATGNLGSRQKRIRAKETAREVLKICAGLLYSGIAHVLPADAPRAPRPASVPAPAPKAETSAPQPIVRRSPISADIDEQLLRAVGLGIAVTSIHIAPMTVHMLGREVGVAWSAEAAELAKQTDSLVYAGLPLEVRAGWAWGYVLGADAEEVHLAA